MGIYIKSMRMPKDCKECDDVCSLSFIGCECYDFELNERPPFCPMSEVPEPHGRLIDADALIPIMKYTTTDNEIGVFPIKIGFDAIKEVINEAPTIIEGSESLER